MPSEPSDEGTTVSETCTLDEIKRAAAGLSPWAYLATVGADGQPDVVPIHPSWEDDTLWVLVATDSVKAHNTSANPNVALHWQATEAGDGVELWGTATLFTDVGTKRRLWDGTFDYDLNAFAPGGPDNSPGAAFLAIAPERAVIIEQYGMGTARRWQKGR